MKNVNIKNKRATFEYQILDKYVAGIQLTGTEIKSIRNSQAMITDAFCTFKTDGSLYVRNMHISEYKFGTYANHEPKRERKLLMNQQEWKEYAYNTFFPIPSNLILVS